MKAGRKCFVSVLLIFLMVFQVFAPLKTASGAMVESSIPISAATYAKEHYQEAVEVVKTYDNYYKATATQLENVKLGTPFAIYELDELVQDEIYYYPLLDSKNNIVLLMSVIGTTDGWSISVSEEWVEELKKLGDITSEFIFYKSGDNLYAENKTDEFCIVGRVDSSIDAFRKKTYLNKKRAVSYAAGHFVKTNTRRIKITNENRNETYAPSFSTSTSSSKICSLYNKKGQGNYGLCWAAAVSTICNYRRGTNITPKAVADKMHIGYHDGANLYKAQQALNRFGVTYNNLNWSAADRMSWASLKLNINDKYPVYVAAKCPKYGHAVTAYGYTIASGTKYVALWNSGENNNKGKSISVVFKESGTTFAYNNTTYTWMYSVSRY